LPELAAPYAHQTLRLNELITSLGLAMGGRPGMRQAHGMGLRIGRDTLLDRIRRINVAPVEKVRVLGVDDFAFRRGKKYGTILVDHERRATIDLLPDRVAETLAQWLKAHPGVEIVTRDRSGAYAAGIRTGAPEALQIADRWRLIKNLSETLEKLLTRHHHDAVTAKDCLDVTQAGRVGGQRSRDGRSSVSLISGGENGTATGHFIHGDDPGPSSREIPWLDHPGDGKSRFIRFMTRAASRYLIFTLLRSASRRANQASFIALKVIASTSKRMEETLN
jgi:hypothetical protein